MTSHYIVSESEWIDARCAFLKKEKELTRLAMSSPANAGSAVGARSRRITSSTRPTGKQSLADLFDGRSQLIIYHFMFAPDWKEGCPSCSYVCRSLRWRDPASPCARRHLRRRLAGSACSDRRVQEAHGLALPLGLFGANDFNYDYHVSFTRQHAKGKVDYNFEPKPNAKMEELPGLSAFHQGSVRRDLPHVLDVRTRPRCFRRHVPVPRCRSQGSR